MKPRHPWIILGTILTFLLGAFAVVIALCEPGRPAGASAATPEVSMREPTSPEADVAQVEESVRELVGQQTEAPQAAGIAPARLIVHLVLEGSGEPLAQAPVTICVEDTDRFSQTTDAEGTARFEVPPGTLTYVWSGRTEVSPPMTFRMEELLCSDTEKGLRLEVNAGTFVPGRVVDQHGNPVPAAHVRAYAPSWPLREPLLVVESDPGGRFRIGPLKGRNVLVAEAPGLIGRNTVDFQLGSWTPGEIVLTLVRPLALRGLVLAADGPAAGATVHARRREWKQLTPGMSLCGPVDADGTTGPDGRFALDVVGLPYEVEINAQGYVPWSGEHDPTSGDLVVTLKEGAALTCVVQNRDGQPIAGALVRLFTAGAEDFPDQTTPEDGTARFAGIDAEAGVVSLLVRAEGYAESWREDLSMRAGDNVLQVVLEPGAEIRGCVLAPDGTPARQSPVYLGPDATVARGRWEQMEWTDDAGRFRFSCLRAGTTHFILAQDSLTSWIRSAEHEVRAGSEVTLQLDAVAYRQVALFGTVKDALTGLPLPEFSVCVFVENSGGVSSFYHGTYELAGYPSSRRLSLVFDAPEHVERSVEARIYERGDHRIDMLLYGSRDVTFRLITPDGRPATEAQLKCIDCDGNDVCWSSLDGKDDQGMLKVAGIPAGPCTIEVRPYPGGPERSHPLDFSAPPARVVELLVEPVAWCERSVSVYGTSDPTATVERLPETIAAGSAWPIERASIEVWMDQTRVFWNGIEREGDAFVWKTSSAHGPAAGPTVSIRMPAIPLRLVVESHGYRKVELPIQPEADARTTVILVQSPVGE